MTNDTDLLLFAHYDDFELDFDAALNCYEACIPNPFEDVKEHESFDAGYLVGHGPTPREAVADLMRKVTDGH